MIQVREIIKHGDRSSALWLSSFWAAGTVIISILAMAIMENKKMILGVLGFDLLVVLSAFIFWCMHSTVPAYTWIGKREDGEILITLHNLVMPNGLYSQYLYFGTKSFFVEGVLKACPSINYDLEVRFNNIYNEEFQEIIRVIDKHPAKSYEVSFDMYVERFIYDHYETAGALCATEDTFRAFCENELTEELSKFGLVIDTILVNNE